ncbi:MAG TPA: hypothetical protein VNJ52_04950 [Patescibacteria group bacterium]|nr:hypothetical protein [Patescibacteria group bacterium]
MEASSENGKTIRISESGLKIKGTVILRAYKADTEELLEEIVTPNLVVDSPSYGLDLVIQRLVGTNTYSLNITHGEIGIGQATPALSDTQLGNDVARVSTTYSADNANQIAVLQFFFPDSTLPNQTYYEFGTFVDGQSSLGTGQMFNHALFTTPYAKVSGVDITVEVDFTLSQ